MIPGMYRFFVRVFAAGDAPTTAAPLPITFEAAQAALARLPQMLVEPDGSFVWTSPAGTSPPWQVDGNLVDRGETLFYVELKGACSEEAFNQLLASLTTSANSFAFEWVERGLLMTEETFRRSAQNPAFLDLPTGD